jgi:hypothetical protein
MSFPVSLEALAVIVMRKVVCVGQAVTLLVLTERLLPTLAVASRRRGPPPGSAIDA